MSEKLARELKALLVIHGIDFWNAVFRLMHVFGFCECGRPGRLCNIGPVHYGVCDLCLKCWALGENNFDWDHETPELWSENAKLLAHCSMTECRYLSVTCNVGALYTVAEFDAWIGALILDKLGDSDARQRIIDHIAESELKGVL